MTRARKLLVALLATVGVVASALGAGATAPTVTSDDGPPVMRKPTSSGQSTANTRQSRPPGELTSLGSPMHGVRTVGGAVGVTDGHPWAYTVSTGDPARFHVVDALTGEVQHSFPLDGAADSYGVAVAPDGRVYATTTNTGRLYRYTPGSESIEDLGRVLESESHVYRVAFDETGQVYLGTYPSGHVVRYDPASGEFHDYGAALDGMRYVRSVAYHEGTVYAGTQPEAHLVAIDVETGAKREIPLPSSADGVAVLYDLTVVGDLLFARASETGVTGTLFVYDLNTEEFIAEFDGANGLETSQLGPDGLVYFMRNHELTGYDPAANELHPTGFVWPGNVTQLRGEAFAELGQTDFPGLSLVGMNWSGDVFWYNPQTSATNLMNTTIEGEPVRIRSMTTGPGDDVYIGGTGIGGLATYDPRSGTTDAHRFGEVQGMAPFGSKVYLGVYPRARVYEYDPTAPWNSIEYSPGDPGTTPNPRGLFDGDTHQQDRPFAVTQAVDKLAIGTVARTGLLGGTLRIYDPATGESEIHSDLVPDQSITALTYRDGVLYGGTSVYGGYGSEPTQTEARLFAWDVEHERMLWSVVPIPGDRTVSSLAWDAQGRLWGISAGAIFQYDPRNDVVSYQRYGDYSWPTQGAYVVAEIGYNRIGNRLYATVPGTGLVRINPRTWEMDLLSDREMYRLTVHDSGDVYVSADTELLRYRPFR